MVHSQQNIYKKDSNMDNKIGFIGGGQMGEALIRGIIESKLFEAAEISVAEPSQERREYMSSTYGIEFPMFAKIEVNGKGACELYQWLTSNRTDQDGKAEIAWNFTKFLIDQKGDIIARFAPQVTPEEIDGEVAKLF
jgi:glutathione peroxidase-family protein